ncbi:MAG: polymerase subunit delta [Sphingomonas bacterium]|nr:DNA polymerase III subunit delta [Sphingomonas bacterium]MDB5688442.1 polymerase subunit delta [Sphingomonas bacterium]
MKADRGQIERAMAAASDAVRLYLLYGPDEAASRELAGQIGRPLGPDAERIDLTGAMLAADPARLADEAASISLFGGRRHIRVEPAGDEIVPAVEALLQANAAGNPVAIVAGALRKDAKLLKLALPHPATLVLASYVSEGANAGRLAVQIGREHGLQMRPDVAQRIADSVSADRALIARECEKYALYLDAAPDRPRELDQDAVDALGADAEEGDISLLVNAVLGGRSDAAEAELATLAAAGTDAIPILRGMQRRLHLLADLRVGMDSGNSVEAVMGAAGKAIFWKEQKVVSQQLARWRPAAIATAIERLRQAEQAFKRGGGLGMVGIAEELLAIGRAASRMRQG